jgi:signal peptidase I
MNVKEMFIRFWKSKNQKVSIIRDVVVALFAVFIILMILWGYTGQWFASPMVAIESGSMEHPNPPFGRLGTIDAGDMVLIQKVTKRSDVIPHGGLIQGAEAENGWQSYGDYGDVIIYHPDGNLLVTPIIHRVICWVQVNNNNGEKTFTINEFGVYNQTSIPPIPELGTDSVLVSPNWTESGYLTKGDNNQGFDEDPNGGILEARQPVRLSWIAGKARSEIPWVGTINMFFNDVVHGGSTVHNVHQDSIICLVVFIAVLISIPIILDVKEYLEAKKKNKQ